MASLADLPEIVGFFSYSRDDDRDSDGGLSTLRRRIQNELRGQLGRSESGLRLWQDAEAIPPGTLWESQIGGAIEQAVFFIPIITPRVIQSKYCQVEFERFLARETEIGRTDLVFPILYIDVPQLKDERRWRDHPVLKAIASRQYVDWCEFRFELDSPNVRRAVAAFARTIVAALERSLPDPRAEADEHAAREREAEERAARERAARESADREREAERAERERAEAARRKQEADEQARLEEERRGERASEEQHRLAAGARQKEEVNRAPSHPDTALSPAPSIIATPGPLDWVTEWLLVIQGAFSFLGVALSLVQEFIAVALVFLAPSLLSLASGILLHLQGVLAPLPRKLIALTIILNLIIDVFIVYKVIESNAIMITDPVIGLSGFTGVVIYILIGLWLILVAWPRFRSR